MALSLPVHLDVIKAVQFMVSGEALAHGPQIVFRVLRVSDRFLFPLGQEQFHDVVTDFGRFEFFFQVEGHIALLVLELVVSAQGDLIQFRRFHIGG
ncbi:hypothetical protein D3C85_1200850 [compost metagenome]